MRWNRELIGRRARIGTGTKGWDIVWMVVFMPLAIGFVVMATEAGGAPASEVMGAGWLAGLVVLCAGWAIATWSMVVNPFFEKTVRIQTDHDHRVVTTGPYAYVRHPGYVGFSGWVMATPMMFASTRLVVPGLFLVLALVIRTALEDRTLRAELTGYADYAARVRYRLIPGIW